MELVDELSNIFSKSWGQFGIGRVAKPQPGVSKFTTAVHTYLGTTRSSTLESECTLYPLDVRLRTGP